MIVSAAMKLRSALRGRAGEVSGPCQVRVGNAGFVNLS